MRLKVIGRYAAAHGLSDVDFVCTDEAGVRHIVDLIVGGSLPADAPDDLIGKTVEVDYLHPYIEIAMYPQIVPPNAEYV